MSDDPALDKILEDFTPEEQADPRLVEAIKGTFEYQRLTFAHAMQEFGHAATEVLGGMFERLDQRRNEALRRWWNDPR